MLRCDGCDQDVTSVAPSPLKTDLNFCWECMQELILWCRVVARYREEQVVIEADE